MATENKIGKLAPCDNTLIKRIKADGCDKSFGIILLRHEKLFYKICQRYIPVILAKGLRKEDIFEEKNLIILKAVRSYKPNKKCKFSTWLGNCTKYSCLTFINNINYTVRLEDEAIDRYFSNKSKEEYDDECNLKSNKDFAFEILNQLKDKRVSKVFKLRYFNNDIKKNKTTWAIIASQLNTSTQTAINLHRKGIEILNKKMNSKETHDII